MPLARFGVIVVALALTGCASVARPPIDLSRAEVVDLTYSFDDHTLYWPNSPSGFELRRLAYGPTPGGYFYSSNTFCAPEHGGTHLDAPIHFAEHGRSADQIPVDQLIAPAVVIDITAKTANDPDYRLTPDDVRAWESANGTIPNGAIVLLRTGWGSRYPDRKAYFGDDTPGATDKLHFPSFGAEAARVLVNDRRVGAIGVDTASIDYGQSRDFIVHQIANGAGVPGLENIANLERVPARGAWVVALPMKIAGGSGGPLRIVALVPR
ncbi:MAG TPA: cyclase family protein [Thermoanaerobaculia bacterium]|nr:cyclase family protein [Thermoanaerobaculia bacterium]